MVLYLQPLCNDNFKAYVTKAFIRVTGLALEDAIKEIQIILRLFIVIAMYSQASSSQINPSLNLLYC